MQFKIPTGPFCQSCALPMEKEEQFGTNADGSKNEDYCTYCFQKGKFTEPNITFDEMLTKVTKAAQEMGMPSFIVGQIKNFLPTLKRWKK
jgi:hypothetical protein